MPFKGVWGHLMGFGVLLGSLRGVWGAFWSSFFWFLGSFLWVFGAILWALWSFNGTRGPFGIPEGILGFLLGLFLG